MRMRPLVLTLLLAGGFWYATSHGQWTVGSLMRPIASGGKLWSDPVTAHGAGFETDEQYYIDIYKTNRLATVNVKSVVMERDFFRVYPKTGIGSGFLINDEGEIVTNFHVIQGSNNITVTLSGGNDHTEYKATVLGSSHRDDLALLRIDAKHKVPFVHLGDSDNLQVGQGKCSRSGTHLDSREGLTTGIVSSLGRNLPNENGTVMEGLIQTDAAINPGNSGGPMFDSRGNVIGINTMILGSQTASGEAGSIGIGFAMPINRAKAILGGIPHYRSDFAPRSWHHFDLSDLRRSRRSSRSARFRRTFDSGDRRGFARGRSRAERTDPRSRNRSIRARPRLGIGGDLITAIDNKKVETSDALTRTMEQKKPGDKIELTVFRGGRSREVTVTLGSAAEVQ